MPNIFGWKPVLLSAPTFNNNLIGLLFPFLLTNSYGFITP